MKAYTAKYKYGFLYNSETGKRILLAEGSDLTVTVKEEDVLKEDPYNYPFIPTSLDEKLSNLKKKDFLEALKIKSNGDSLFFEISAGIRSKKLEPLKCLFEVKLQEELIGARKDTKKDFDLVDCYCIVTSCLTNNLPFFEPIHAYSLNDVYSKTYDFYFRLYGKQSANVKIRMMEKLGGDANFLKKKLNKVSRPDFILHEITV